MKLQLLNQTGIQVEIVASSSDTPFETLCGVWPEKSEQAIDDKPSVTEWEGWCFNKDENRDSLSDFMGCSLDQVEMWLRATYPEYEALCREIERP